jgi:hypothetical protein
MPCIRDRFDATPFDPACQAAMIKIDRPAPRRGQTAPEARPNRKPFAPSPLFTRDEFIAALREYYAAPQNNQQPTTNNQSRRIRRHRPQP